MWLPRGGLRECCFVLVSGFCLRALFKPVPRAVRVERFEVEAFDRLRGVVVRRLVPDCEALEPVSPGNVIEACLVRLREGGPPPLQRAAV